MSVIREKGTKVVLPRSGPDHFWKLVQVHYAGDDEQKWKYLAMLALRENAGWPLEQIGKVFNHSKGHVTRCLTTIKRELRAHFQMAPEVLDLEDDELLREDDVHWDGSSEDAEPVPATLPFSDPQRSTFIQSDHEPATPADQPPPARPVQSAHCA